MSKNSVVFTARADARDLALVLTYLHTQGYETTTRSALVADAIELLSQSLQSKGFELPSFAEAQQILIQTFGPTQSWNRGNKTLIQEIAQQEALINLEAEEDLPKSLTERLKELTPNKGGG